MDFEIRAATDHDLDDVVRAVMAAYGEHASDDTLADARTVYELDRTFAAFDADGRPVGVAAAITFDLTAPGGAALPGAGFMDIGVLPTHRRRGVLTALMARHLDESRARGEAISTLIAAEGGIYNRFGYGVATLAQAVEIDTRDAAFRSPVACEHRLVPPEEAAIVLPELYDAYRRSQPGEASRDERFWDVLLRRAHDVFVVVNAGGYATYRITEVWRHGQAAFECDVEELVSVDVASAAQAALWRYLLDLDLVSVVRAGNTPPDTSLRWLLADPRALRSVGVRDWLWLRLVDVPKALAARRYAVAARVVIDVVGEGRFLLDGSPHGAECRPAPDQGPDLSLGLDDLGAAYLGGVSLATLARAGRVVEHTRGTLTRADTMFRSGLPPHCTTDF